MKRIPAQQDPAALAKRRTRHRIIYDGTLQADVEAVMMAMTGMTSKAIAAATGLTVAQVQYRIVKAQRAENTNYRGQWRNGHSPWVARFQRTVGPAMKAAIRNDLPPKFALPPVKVSPAGGSR